MKTIMTDDELIMAILSTDSVLEKMKLYAKAYKHEAAKAQYDEMLKNHIIWGLTVIELPDGKKFEIQPVNYDQKFYEMMAYFTSEE